MKYEELLFHLTSRKQQLQFMLLLEARMKNCYINSFYVQKEQPLQVMLMVHAKKKEL